MPRITILPWRYGWATLRTPLCTLSDAGRFFPAELIRHTRNDMKLWLSGLALLRRLLPRRLKISASCSLLRRSWISGSTTSDNTPQSWCKPEVALRIVANGKKDVSVLENFVPRLGALLEHQCSKVNNSAMVSTIRREPRWRRARLAKRRTGRWW